MNRYRLGLAGLVALVAAAVVVTTLRNPAPPSVASTSGTLIAADQRAAAPDFTGIDGWINSPSLTMAGLRGKVVLVDFWTFSCVNCVRTIPHLQTLYAAYGHDGLVIVGVHSPEFDFEKVRSNVAAAVTRLGVTWPVAIDSEMATWSAYANQYWPAEYLIDQQGRVAYTNFGEGMYDVTDAAVASLLGARAATIPQSTPIPGNTTPELYAGSQRGQLADGEGYASSGQPAHYPDPGPPRQQDAIQVTGAWSDHGEYLQADGAGHVRLQFHADSVYVVAGTTGGTLQVAVRLDGEAVAASLRGPSLAGSGFAVTRQDLLHLLAGVPPGHHLIDLTVAAGFRLYTFTFG